MGRGNYNVVMKKYSTTEPTRKHWFKLSPLAHNQVLLCFEFAVRVHRQKMDHAEKQSITTPAYYINMWQSDVNTQKLLFEFFAKGDHHSQANRKPIIRRQQTNMATASNEKLLHYSSLEFESKQSTVTLTTHYIAVEYSPKHRHTDGSQDARLRK